MAHEEDEETKKFQYPLDSNCYRLVDEIGRGVSAIVYKAECLPLNSAVVAIKSIDLDRSKADFESVRREAKTMTLLSHPNILKAHCSFTVDRRLWVVMPFMSAGSLQSIVASSFPDGLTEPCISIVLKEALIALSYLHNQGHLHRDIKAGNILVDANGAVKLADFGVSASIYESSFCQSSWVSSSSSNFLFTDIAGTPYWMAPEVIHSHTGYSYKADIWSFGITALELAHGRPPLSHLPPSKSLLMKITKRFRFSDYEKAMDSKNKKFSKSFKEMVGLCLDQDPSKRPSAEKLLKHSFFKNCKGPDFLIKNVLQGLPSVEQRFKIIKRIRATSESRTGEEDEEDEEDLEGAEKQRRISGWNFNVERFELEPVFPTEKQSEEIVKKVQFGGETIIHENLELVGDTQLEEEQENEESGAPEQSTEIVGGGIDKEIVLDSLSFLISSLDDQRQKVEHVMSVMQGRQENLVVNREDNLMEVIENLCMDLEIEKKKNADYEAELEFLRMQLNCDATD